MRISDRDETFKNMFFSISSMVLKKNLVEIIEKNHFFRIVFLVSQKRTG
jgi:hypothetical protein